MLQLHFVQRNTNYTRFFYLITLIIFIVIIKNSIDSYQVTFFFKKKKSINVNFKTVYHRSDFLNIIILSFIILYRIYKYFLNRPIFLFVFYPFQSSFIFEELYFLQSINFLELSKFFKHAIRQLHKFKFIRTLQSSLV